MIVPLTTLGDDRPYTMEEYEEAIKTLGAAEKVLKDYARNLSLGDKIEYHKAALLCSKARNQVRLHYYEHEDALATT